MREDRTRQSAKEQVAKLLRQEARKHAEEIDYQKLLEHEELVDALFKRIVSPASLLHVIFQRASKDETGSPYLNAGDRAVGFKKKLLLAALKDPRLKKRMLQEITYRVGLLESFEIAKKEFVLYETWVSVRAFLKERLGLVVASIVALAIIAAPLPGAAEFAGKTVALSAGGKHMLALLAFLVIMFLTEAMPIGATVGIVYAWIIGFGILPERDAAGVLSHDAVWLLVGALMIANVLIKYGLHKHILFLIMRIVGSKTRYIAFGIIAFGAISASFISGHTVAALLLPLGLAIIQVSGGFERAPRLSRLILLSIAFGSNIGGLGAPSGGGRNVIMIGFLSDTYGLNIGYGSWMAMGMPIVLLLIPIVWGILVLLFPPEVADLRERYTAIRGEMRMSRMGFKQWAVVGIFFLTLALWMTQSEHGIGMIALLGAVLFLAFGLADWKDYQGINWGVVLLYFGAIGLGKCLILSGAAAWMAASSLTLISRVIPVDSQMAITVIGTIMMSGLTQIMSDGVTVSAIGPVLLEIAELTATDPVFLGIAAAMSSSFAFMLIIGTPSNAIVYGSGYLTTKDFLKGGCLVYVACLAVLLLMTRFWWGWLGVGVGGLH